MSPRTRRTKHDSITNKENAKMNGHEAVTKTVRAKSKRKVYCTCRQPDDGMPMISCSECEEWYVFSSIDLFSSIERKFFLGIISLASISARTMRRISVSLSMRLPGFVTTHRVYQDSIFAPPVTKRQACAPSVSI